MENAEVIRILEAITRTGVASATLADVAAKTAKGGEMTPAEERKVVGDLTTAISALGPRARAFAIACLREGE